ncbi:hypothetical protein [Amycolatopsis magusensis]|uniref:hypothetical protein n=1 Tax=Amycolatopsis magusensis TaxID=882444 RepID=UPI00379CBD5D
MPSGPASPWRPCTTATWSAIRSHDALLRRRPERRATLLVKPDNVPARTAYLSWGWELFGQVRPFEDAPVYDSLMLTSMPDQGGE